MKITILFTFSCCRRFGPGRLSQRWRQTERLRELRAENNGSRHRFLQQTTPTVPMSHIVTRCHDVHGGEDHAEPDRVPSKETCIVERGSVKKEIPIADTTATSIVEGSAVGAAASVSDDFIGNLLALKTWDTPSAKRLIGTTTQCGSTRTQGPVRLALGTSTGARNVLFTTERASTAEHRLPAARRTRAIPSIRSAPTPLKSRRPGRGRVEAVSDSTKQPQQHEGGSDKLRSHQVQPTNTCRTFFTAAMAPSDADYAFCSTGQVGHAQTVLMEGDGRKFKPELGWPSVTDTCGGVILRLSPTERPLDPWDHLVAPLRAMCDIDPSLSRAGIACRSVIPAVEGAQEIMSHDQAKVLR